MEKGYLLLEDGTTFEGFVFGDTTVASLGEVVFNTGMTGYQEVLTDPSYHGQIVVMTYPLVGNYGINAEDHQSEGPTVKGFIVRELTHHYSNWRGSKNLESYFKDHGILGLEGVDTRALTRHIRHHGAMPGMIVKGSPVKWTPIPFDNADAVYQVTTPEAYDLPGGPLKIAVMDFGIKGNILTALQKKGFSLRVFPADAPVAEILAYSPDGLFLSNGPGDPAKLTEIVKKVRVLSSKLPTFGICLGHQLLAHAYGATTEKMVFGHRGSNHPVKDLVTGRVVITSQNHGYHIVEESLPAHLVITHRNLNDQTVEGIKHRDLPIFSVQYHPEASPGPGDSVYLFEEFYNLVKGVVSCEKCS